MDFAVENRNNNHIYRLMVWCMVVMISGCGQQSSEVSTDITPEPQEAAPEMLPDTVFASTEAVRWRVDTISDLPGTLDCVADMYADAPGVLTFRANSFRDGGDPGVLDSVPTGIVTDWRFVTGEDYTLTDYGRWGGGTGWTGQPLLVDRKNSRNTSAEVIVGSLCGKVYFIDFATGSESRPAIDAGNPVKGTVSLDPVITGNLYVGHGVPVREPFGAAVVDLESHKIGHMTDRDPSAWRGWGAYDSSPLRVGQFLLRPGENGTLYKYVAERGTLRLHSSLRYSVGGAAPGVEASMSAYRNYGYLSDNHGNILCVNLNNLHPVWHYALGDDSDATPVVTEEDGGVYLYVGCEIDRRGKGAARIAKLNALTGQPVWVTATEGRRVESEGKHFDGGYYATPLPGRGDCSHLLFANCVLNTDTVRRNGVFQAIDRRDGHIAYTRDLGYYSWSSPVGMIDPDGRYYVVTADCSGTVHLLRGIDGKEIDRRHVGMNFESSPAVRGNKLILGSRGNSIYKLSIE